MIFSLELELFIVIISKSVNYQTKNAMKTIRLLFLILLISVKPLFADSDYIESVQTLGYVSGEGLACGAKQYKSYETIARAYLVSSAKSDKEQAQGMLKYNQAKATAYMNKRESGLYDCATVRERFGKQKILKSKLYKNGTIQLPDGKVIKPRNKYDATLLYDKSVDEKAKLDKFYDGIIEKKKKQAVKEGIMKKIQQYEKNIY